LRKEAQRPIGGWEIPPEAALLAFLSVGNVALTSVSYMRTGEYLTRDDRLRVLGDGIGRALT
jgi:hypothetical protein